MKSQTPHPKTSPDFPKPGISPHLGKDVVAPDIPGEQGKETLPTADILTEVTSVLVGTGSGFPAAAGYRKFPAPLSYPLVGMTPCVGEPPVEPVITGRVPNRYCRGEGQMSVRYFLERYPIIWGRGAGNYGAGSSS